VLLGSRMLSKKPTLKGTPQEEDPRGLATALMLGKSPTQSAVFASAVAAVSVTRAGAQPSNPSIPEVEDLLDKQFV